MTGDDAPDADDREPDGTDDDGPGDADDVVAPAVRERIEGDPFCAKLGVEVVDLAPGAARTRLAVDESLLNFHGTLHGGACYALADAAFAAASNARGETALALEANVSYLEAVDAGETLVATATETHRSGRTAEYEVVVEREPAPGVDRGDRVATFRGRVYLPDG